MTSFKQALACQKLVSCLRMFAKRAFKLHCRRYCEANKKGTLFCCSIHLSSIPPETQLPPSSSNNEHHTDHGRNTCFAA